MKMKISTIFAAVPLVMLLTGCERAADQHAHEEIDELRMEVDQLTNAVGRLEFRVYELEDHHDDIPVTRAPDSTQQKGTDSAAAEPTTEDGRFDLTPVE